MDNEFGFATLQTIEDRLEHATQYARHKMRWFWRFLPLFTIASLVQMALVFEPMLRSEPWALALGAIFFVTGLLGMTGFSRYMKSFSEPTAEQKAAIEEALAARNYPLAIQLVDEMVTFIAGVDALKLAATVYLRGGKFHEGQITSQEVIERLEGYSTSRSTKKERAEHKRNISDAQTLLGISYSGQRRYAEAEQMFSQAMKTDPRHEWPMPNYAESLLYQRKSIDVALETIQRAAGMWAKNNPQPKAAHATTRAWAYAIQGDRPAAEKWIQESIRLAAVKNNPVITSEVDYVIGLTYQALGDTEQARRAFNDAIHADPHGLTGQLAARELADLAN